MPTNSKTTSSQSSVASALETQLRKIDRHKSGLLEPKEFETAVQKSGLNISKAEVQEVSKALGAASSSGLVAYQDVLTRIYDKIEAFSPSSISSAAPIATVPAVIASPADGTSSPAASGDSTLQPQWYVSRQRRIKTEVALCMGQQPKATAASAANVETPQEKAHRQTRATGKKIQGLFRPGEYENTGSPSAFNGDLNITNTNYWFADYQNASETPAGINIANKYNGGGGDGNGGMSELWFSKAGEDEKALKATDLWRPTKDVSINIAKRKNNKNDTKGGSSGSGCGSEGNEEQGLPATKPPVVKAKPAPP